MKSIREPYWKYLELENGFNDEYHLIQPLIILHSDSNDQILIEQKKIAVFKVKQ